MSAATDAKIAELQKAIEDAKKAMDIEKYQQTVGQQNLSAGKWNYGYAPYAYVGETEFKNWLAASANSLKIKESNYASAVSSLESYMKTLSAATLNEAVKTNPNLLIEIEKAKGEVELNKGKELFAQATTKYLIWGAIILVVIVVVIIVIKKKFGKGA